MKRSVSLYVADMLWITSSRTARSTGGSHRSLMTTCVYGCALWRSSCSCLRDSSENRVCRMTLLLLLLSLLPLAVVVCFFRTGSTGCTVFSFAPEPFATSEVNQTGQQKVGQQQNSSSYVIDRRHWRSSVGATGDINNCLFEALPSVMTAARCVSCRVVKRGVAVHVSVLPRTKEQLKQCRQSNNGFYKMSCCTSGIDAAS